MPQEEILNLIKEYFTEEWCEEDGNGWVEFSGKPGDFYMFAKAIYEKGYNGGRGEGWREGYDGGYGEGWREGYDVGVIEYSND